MGMHGAKIPISADTYAAAERIAAMDQVSVSVLVESLVKRHVEYIDSLTPVPAMPTFSLGDYEMLRDPDEAEEDYQARLSLFR